MENCFDTIDDGLISRESGIWVEEKLDYLCRYIDIFETSMRDKFSTRFYIDLLAGPGKNRIRENGRFVFGSPLIALRTKYPFSHYIFNEYDKNSFSALETRCAEYKDKGIYLFNQDCNELPEKIIRIINSTNRYSLNLAFIDPEGFEVKWETVAKLASISRLDLLIYYPQKGLNQNLKKFYDCKGDCIIDRYFGTREWREIYQSSLEKNRLHNIHRDLINLYKNRLSSLGYVEVLSDEEIGSEPLIRNLERKAPLYRLLFASKHKLGKDFWNKITRRNIYGQKQLF